MQTLQAKDIQAFLPADVEIIGITWINADQDLDLHLRLPKAPGETTQAHLIATWAHNLHLDLHLEGRQGVLPTWEINITSEDKKSWKVLFDFGNENSISFECNDLRLEIPSE